MKRTLEFLPNLTSYSTPYHYICGARKSGTLISALLRVLLLSCLFKSFTVNDITKHMVGYCAFVRIYLSMLKLLLLIQSVPRLDSFLLSNLKTGNYQFDESQSVHAQNTNVITRVDKELISAVHS